MRERENDATNLPRDFVNCARSSTCVLFHQGTTQVRVSLRTKRQVKDMVRHATSEQVRAAVAVHVAATRPTVIAAKAAAEARVAEAKAAVDTKLSEASFIESAIPTRAEYKVSRGQTSSTTLSIYKVTRGHQGPGLTLHTSMIRTPWYSRSDTRWPVPMGHRAFLRAC
eukprot:1324578-Prymnesium_polylepis.1